MRLKAIIEFPVSAVLLSTAWRGVPNPLCNLGRGGLGIFDRGPGLVCVGTSGAVAKVFELRGPSPAGEIELFKRNEALRLQEGPGPLAGQDWPAARATAL